MCAPDFPCTFSQLRLTVGDSEGLRSGSYKAWQHRGSFYIKCRESGPGDMKVSLHPEVFLAGWQGPWARENPGALLPQGHPSRVSFVPTPARLGLTRVLTIVIPSAAVNWPEPCKGKDVVWLPRPPHEHAIEVMFALVSAPITLRSDSLIGCLQGDGPGDPDLVVAYRQIPHQAHLSFTGSLATPSGESVTDPTEVSAALPYMRGFGMGQKGDGSWFLEEVAVTHQPFTEPTGVTDPPRSSRT